MKKATLSAIIVLGFISVFQTLGAGHSSDSLTSTTYIEANQSFVLGEGKHGSYTAKIVNKGKVDVEVFTEPVNEAKKSLGVLKPKDAGEYNVAEDTQVIFKNLGREKAVIGIKLSGETNLSMGYKPNKQ